MRHFTTEDAVDFVNQVIPASRKRAMEEHQKNCRRCSKAISQLQRVRECAATESNYQPPQETVRIARSAFAALESSLRGKTTGASIEVLFDSFLQPIVEGLRSKGDGARQILYRADPYQIDLQIEAGSGRNTLVIIGRVHDSRQPTSSGRDVSVVISDLQGQVVLATTDRFGVFRKEVCDSGDLDLFFPKLTDKLLRIALRDPLRRLPKEKHLRVVRNSGLAARSERKLKFGRFQSRSNGRCGCTREKRNFGMPS